MFKFNPKNFLHFLLLWCFPTMGITLISTLIYTGVQQVYRQSANDPQIQMAEDGARELSTGLAPQLFLIDQGVIDMRESLAPFYIIYDNNGQPVAASAELNGITPAPPLGVFQYVRHNGEDRITWQPTAEVRLATVITSYNSASSSGFILAGRSLREIEKREALWHWAVLTVWILALAISFIAICLILPKVLERKS